MNSKLSKSVEPDLRIVLLGKTGVGKSASGNTILGKSSFTEEQSPESKTMKRNQQKTEFKGKTLTITDTPGLFHTSKDRKELVDEILHTTLQIQPGPHVLLLVLRLGSFSREDKKVLETFQKVFTDAKRYTIVLFTHGGECDVEKFIEKNESLKEFINQSCAKHHVFNNEDKDDAQVTSLLQKISDMVEENGGGYYTNKMFEEAEKTLMEVMQRANTEPEPGNPDIEEAIVQLKSWITKGTDLLQKHDPGLVERVTRFLDYVKEVTYKWWPEEAKK